MAELCSDLGIPWGAETPLFRPNKPSVFRLPEWGRVLQRPTVNRGDLDQCQYEDIPKRPPNRTYTKGTTLESNVELDGVVRRCCCPMATWTVFAGSSFRTSQGHDVRTPVGRRFKAPHPPLIGTREAVLAGTDLPPVRRSGASSGFLTRDTAHYPAELTWQIIATLALEATRRRRAQVATGGAGKTVAWI